MKAEQVRLLSIVSLTLVAAVGVILICTLLSLSAVFALKFVVALIARVITFIGELLTAVLAAIVSGGTISLTVVLSASAAAMAFPSSCIEGRITVSIAVSVTAMMSSAAAVIFFSAWNVDLEIAASVVGAAAMSVAFASAWAVGVMSLIEKETQHVGLKMTSITDAARHNQYRLLNLLVKLNAGLKQRDLDTALLHAVKGGFFESAQVLLNAKANPNCKDAYENTPLIIACETGSARLARLLLDCSADAELRNGSSRCTALHQAAKWGYESCVELLLKHYSANCNVEDGLGRTPLMLAAKHARTANTIMRSLVEAGSNVNVIGDERTTALHYAAMRGLDVGLLLAAGASPLVQDGDGNLPLHLAAMGGFPDTVECFVRAMTSADGSGNLDATNYQRRSALHFAALHGHTDCVRILLDSGASQDLTDSQGNLPVSYAAHGGHLKATFLFLQRNGLFLQRSGIFHSAWSGERAHSGENEASPLAVALARNHLSVSRLLLMGGCDPRPLYNWLTDLVQPEDVRQTAQDVANKEAFHWLREYASKPSSLSHACRLTIRRLVRKDFWRNVNHTPLPRALREFLQLKDLEDELTREESKEITTFRIST